MMDSRRPQAGALQRMGRGLRLIWLAGVALGCAPVTPLLGQARTTRLMRWWYGRLLHVLGIQVRLHGELPQTTVLIAATHTTWLDIVVLSHVFGAVFISKDEVGRWPVFGTYARACGTLFLIRGANKTADINQQIHTALASGRSVVLFPEGTTTDEVIPRRFHARLFAAAVDGNHPVQPVILRYASATTPAGEHHPDVPWVNAPLSTNVRRILGMTGLHVDVGICAPIAAAGHDRKSLSRASQAAIAQYARQL